MKCVKLLLSTVVFLLLTTTAYTQTPRDSSVYFFLRTGMMGTFANIDTLNILNSNGDTIDFTSFSGNFSKRGNQIYGISDYDTFLLYDYGLVAGDTFDLEYFNGVYNDRLSVDSLSTITTLDGTVRRQWHLTSLSRRFNITWIEGIGSNYSWDYTSMYLIDYPVPFLKAICDGSNDLMYWDTSSAGFKPNEAPDPSCNFEEMKKHLSVQSTSGPLNSIKVSPNPVYDRLFIDLNDQFSYTIYNNYGQEVLSGTTQHSIPVMDLLPGFYFIQISVRNEWMNSSFIKN